MEREVESSSSLTVLELQMTSVESQGNASFSSHIDCDQMLFARDPYKNEILVRQNMQFEKIRLKNIYLLKT